MNADKENAPIDGEINDPGNEDPGSVWPIQQDQEPTPQIDEAEEVYEQDDAE